jgi:hypothetical protein
MRGVPGMPDLWDLLRALVEEYAARIERIEEGL